MSMQEVSDTYSIHDQLEDHINNVSKANDKRDSEMEKQLAALKVEVEDLKIDLRLLKQKLDIIRGQNDKADNQFRTHSD